MPSSDRENPLTWRAAMVAESSDCGGIMPDDMTHEALPHQVTETDIVAFRRDGVVCLRGAVDDPWIDALRLAVDRDIAAPGPLARHNTPAGRPGRFFVDFQLWQRWPACRDFAFGS